MNTKSNNKCKFYKTDYLEALYSGKSCLYYSPLSENDRRILAFEREMGNKEIKPHCFVDLYDGDLCQIVNWVVSMALEISKDPICANTEINAFEEQFSELLPKTVIEAIKEKMQEIGKTSIESDITDVNKTLDEDTFNLSGDFEYPDGNIYVSFTCKKGRFFTFLSRIYPFRCTILALDENNNVVLSKNHFEVFAKEFSEQGLIEVIRRFCKE